ncbi:MAG: hypothetical protein M3R27_07615, partial [Bacteroidota bacterium]|nr:hypothetical protein [Bacteroidota bacterium]
LGLFLILVNMTMAVAQVKIGDNPSTINANSMLELESTNKGFLPPRIALNNINAIAPLTAATPSGMLVFSCGGSVSDGYYYWNGSKWLALSTSSQVRNNFVLVKTAADLPAPVGGIITLATGVLYELNGTITISDKIDLNGCAIQGDDASNDKLVYTGTAEMFTGSNVGNISYMTLTASSGKVFNINALSANKNMIVQNCFFIGCNTIGTIQGVGGTVFFSTVAFFYNTNGVTYQNNNNVILNNTLWDVTNSNTYEKFIGSFNVIQILGGDRLVSSANSAIAEDISGISSVAGASIKVVMFLGSGTNIIGSFSNSWEVEASGLNTEKDDVASGNLYIFSPAATTFITAGVPVKIAGSSTAASLFRVSSAVNNQLKYTGAKSRRFQVICSLSATQVSTNKYFSFYIAKNGVVLPESRQEIKIESATDQAPVTLSCTISLSPNDYIEVWVENETATTSMTVQTMNLAIK